MTKSVQFYKNRILELEFEIEERLKEIDKFRKIIETDEPSYQNDRQQILF